ncbi:MAG TPA: hypothetical protein VKU94_01980 [Geobacterales bacterium]|nr:hypothetical protein [Geobacterales bacterium]
MNTGALIAILAFFAVLLAIFGSIYFSASKAAKNGEISPKGLRILQLGLIGHITILLLLLITAFLT